MEIGKLLLIVVLGYLLGSLSSSILLSRTAWGGDVRGKGSGNAGATNMARVYGWAAGILTLLCDMLKAAVAVWIGWKLMGDRGLAAGGIACMLGHCFPVFHHFKGGKGISVGAVLALAIDWRVFLCVLAVFLIVALLTRKVSAGSLAAAVAISIAAVAFSVAGVEHSDQLASEPVVLCLHLRWHTIDRKNLFCHTMFPLAFSSASISSSAVRGPSKTGTLLFSRSSR